MVVKVHILDKSSNNDSTVDTFEKFFQCVI